MSFDVAKFQKQQRKEAVKYPKEKFQDKDIKRQLGMYSKLGPPGLPDDKYIKVSGLMWFVVCLNTLYKYLGLYKIAMYRVELVINYILWQFRSSRTLLQSLV